MEYNGAKELSSDDAEEFDKAFEELEDYVAAQQEKAPNSATLRDAIDSFVKSRKLSGLAKAGLEMRAESTWTQEYAASPSKLSLNYFDSDSKLDGGDSIIAKGYVTLVNLLKGAIEAKGGKILLSQPVTAISYDDKGVTVTTTKGSFTGKFAVITIPVGVLQAGKVKFSPPLPAAKQGAISRLGMGTLNKVIMAFPDSLQLPSTNWFSRIPTPTDQGRFTEFFSLNKAAGRPVVVGFNAGDAALYPSSLTDEALVAQAVSILRSMFGKEEIPNPTKTWVTRWHADPWSLGSYSVVAPGANGSERKLLRSSVSKKLYWAGEATHSKYPSTVQGAYLSGEEAAKEAAAENPVA